VRESVSSPDCLRVALAALVVLLCGPNPATGTVEEGRTSSEPRRTDRRRDRAQRGERDSKRHQQQQHKRSDKMIVAIPNPEVETEGRTSSEPRRTDRRRDRAVDTVFGFGPGLPCCLTFVSTLLTVAIYRWC
jgi:uncharacterized protein involved in copper resistance